MTLRWWHPMIIVYLAGLLVFSACTRATPEGQAALPTVAPNATAAAPTSIAPLSQICIETVVIQGGKVIPETLTVKAPCVVLFSNRDDAVHQIQGHDFLLGEIGKDQSWAHTYNDPGSFPYLSTKDPALRGRVIVQP